MTGVLAGVRNQLSQNWPYALALILSVLEGLLSMSNGKLSPGWVSLLGFIFFLGLAFIMKFVGNNPWGRVLTVFFLSLLWMGIARLLFQHLFQTMMFYPHEAVLAVIIAGLLMWVAINFLATVAAMFYEYASPVVVRISALNNWWKALIAVLVFGFAVFFVWFFKLTRPEVFFWFVVGLVGIVLLYVWGKARTERATEENHLPHDDLPHDEEIHADADSASIPTPRSTPRVVVDDDGVVDGTWVEVDDTEDTQVSNRQNLLPAPPPDVIIGYPPQTPQQTPPPTPTNQPLAPFGGPSDDED